MINFFLHEQVGEIKHKVAQQVIKVVPSGVAHVVQENVQVTAPNKPKKRCALRTTRL